MNQGIHTIDLLLWLLGPVRRVSALTATQLHAIEVEDTIVGWLQFASGAVATYEATTAAYPGYRRRVELTTTGGTLVLEHDRVIAADTREPYDEPGTSAAAADTNTSASSPIVSDGRGHQRLIEDFIEAIATGREPRCSGVEGRRSIAAAEAMYESARSGRVVDVRD